MIDRLDHLVLTVASISSTLDFYHRALRFEPREKDGRWSLHFGRQKINLHQQNHTFDPKAAHPTPGSADLCFIATQSLEQIMRRLAEEKISTEEGPVARTGALGPMTSIYFRDPDRNLIEISVYDKTF
ncbi:VOC family protein [Terriglobus saanensis]|uniref:Glyoxalase/bleomycin resistance protein/dioxygenase n=1 Tax=Terriglobus saanensis (strain ATCC BAA-1853 / DSM 23119 / SP1PR4) TaxID=401053 RepID=E8V820_TERSS|nr:VOC family protein [Terriglobus saanensis]ADV84002.1 Glyoxalase/bleomycin resistance protein/dioxygenase [Terriglobus saanensis SP1PR4]